MTDNEKREAIWKLCKLVAENRILWELSLLNNAFTDPLTLNERAPDTE